MPDVPAAPRLVAVAAVVVVLPVAALLTGLTLFLAAAATTDGFTSVALLVVLTTAAVGDCACWNALEASDTELVGVEVAVLVVLRIGSPVCADVNATICSRKTCEQQLITQVTNYNICLHYKCMVLIAKLVLPLLLSTVQHRHTAVATKHIVIHSEITTCQGSMMLL
jgi:hypothetical protein